MTQKAKITAFMIFKIVCLAVGLLLWFGGLAVFTNMMDGEGAEPFIGWILWGFFALLSMPLELLKNLISGAKEGAIEGANTFKIRDYGSTFTVGNSPTGGAFKGILTSAIAMLLVGPVLLGFKVLGNLFVIISCIGALRKINSAGNGN